MIKLNSDLADAIHDFGSGMKCSFPEHREGITEWKVEIGDCVQDLFREALFPECSFSRNTGKCADRALIILVLVSHKRSINKTTKKDQEWDTLKSNFEFK